MCNYNKMNKLITYFKYLFRKRLKISSDFINVGIADFNFKQSQKDIINYNIAVANSKNDSLKINQHPLYYTKVSWRIIENLNNLLVEKIDDKILKSIVHLSDSFVFHKQISLNSDLIIKSKIWNISHHRKGTKMTLKFDYYSDNELIAEEYTTGLMFGVKYIGQDKFRGEMPKTLRVDTKPIWQKSIEIDKNLPYFYAEKAEIDAPIHTDPTFAISIGLPDIILQGTCTFAKAVSLILYEEFRDKKVVIKSVSAKFTGMVTPQDSIRIRLLNKEKYSFYFDVLNNKDQAVIKGGEIQLK